MNLPSNQDRPADDAEQNAQSADTRVEHVGTNVHEQVAALLPDIKPTHRDVGGAWRKWL